MLSEECCAAQRVNYVHIHCGDILKVTARASSYAKVYSYFIGNFT